MKFWFDGKIVDEKRVNIPLLTHSLHYGSAIFEGIRFYKTEKGPAVFRLKEHIDRFFYSAEALAMKIPYTKKVLEKAVLDTVFTNKFSEGYIRPIGYFGNKMGLDPKGSDVHIAIAAWPWGKYLKEKVRVKISPVMRIHPKSTSVGAKISGHYTNSILATRDAKDDGFDEALLLDYTGAVAEGPGENVFFVKGINIVTPKKGSILTGITRDSIITIAKDLGYRVSEKDIYPSDIKNFDEAFFTGTAAEVTLIESIDKKRFSKFDVSKEIREEFYSIVKGENKKYKKWLTHAL